MPPKNKKVEEEVKQKLGKPGNTLQMGIVGLPNVGKSTTFNLLSKASKAEAANYPFCTIDPNLAQVPVQDERFDKLVEIHKPKSQVKAVLKILDIAGLVPGAHKGEGLGNAFLSHIRETDAIFQVVRAFDDPEVTHTENDVNPVRDMEIIKEELLLKDIELNEKKVEDLKRKVARNGQDDESKAELTVLQKAQDVMVNQKKWIHQADWTNKEIQVLNTQCYLTAKQIIYLVNLSEADYLRKKNKWLAKIANWVKETLPGQVIPYSAEYEQNLVDNGKADDPSSMLNKIIKSGYRVLDLQYFFTAGADEVRAWTIRKGCKAPRAAGVIHTDFEKGFIAAEIMSYDDFIRCGTEAAVKAEGKYLSKGREHEIQDGDIILFRFNVSKGGKK